MTFKAMWIKAKGWTVVCLVILLVAMTLPYIFGSGAEKKQPPAPPASVPTPVAPAPSSVAITTGPSAEEVKLKEEIASLRKAMETLQQSSFRQADPPKPESIPQNQEEARTINVHTNVNQNVNVGSPIASGNNSAPVSSQAQKTNQHVPERKAEEDFEKAEKISQLEDQLEKHQYMLSLAKHFISTAPRGKFGDLERISQGREIRYRNKEIKRIKDELEVLQPKPKEQLLSQVNETKSAKTESEIMGSKVKPMTPKIPTTVAPIQGTSK